MVEKDEDETNEDKNNQNVGDIYMFNQNRNYYDSLESIEILRNHQPYFIDPKES